MNLMNALYRLHYAPDNASVIVRITLEMLGAPYDLVLVDRARGAQETAAYRAVNPLGMIPALETPEGPLFETGAVLLWLCDRHQVPAGPLLPRPNDPARGEALKWLFFLSNSLHAGLRQMFYPKKFIAPAHAQDLRSGIAERVKQDFAQMQRLIEDPDCTVIGGAQPSVLDLYLCTCFRWAQIYPKDFGPDWLDVRALPGMTAHARRIEALPEVIRIQQAEGLGETPFSCPEPPNPLEGSAT